MLFAALLLPWFINWDDYKTGFERQAGRILGHPVRVTGSASASILPTPSLSFTNVQVGDPSAPLMTVDRFDVTVELVPLLQSEIRVISMVLERPVARLDVNAQGDFTWLDRFPESDHLEPDKVSLAAVDVRDGEISYRDPHAGVAFSFRGINASVEARSLAGPWRVDGSYVEDGAAVPFHLATGRSLDDGSVRVRADFSPAEMPITIVTDGIVAQDPAWGLAYSGTYTLRELVENISGQAVSEGGPALPGWRSEGAFTLNRDRVSIDKAVFSNGPPDRPAALAGAIAVEFGKNASFRANLEARQVDLDRVLGEGPEAPVEVSAAIEALFERLENVPQLSIPGRVALAVPAIVIGGALVQDVHLSIANAEAGWEIQEAQARLPGQTNFNARGIIATGMTPSFSGNALLSVQNPVAFASWWRGKAGTGAGRALPSFDISADIDTSGKKFVASNLNARIGSSDISGAMFWQVDARTGASEVGGDLRARVVNLSQISALAELLAGQPLKTTVANADSYKAILAADELFYDGLHFRNVSVDASYAGDVLNLTNFSVGDVGGSSFRVSGGRVEGLLKSDEPRGQLDVRVDVRNVAGLAELARRFIPRSGVDVWLDRAGTSLVPASLTARISGGPGENGSATNLVVNDAVVGDTVFSATATFQGGWNSWHGSDAALDLSLRTPRARALLQQLGLDPAEVEGQGIAAASITARGIPAREMLVSLKADIAGADLSGEGEVSLLGDDPAEFSGNIAFSADDVSSLTRMAGLGSAASGPVQVNGEVLLRSDVLTAKWRNGTFGNRRVSADLKLLKPAQSSARLEGAVTLDQLDLDWLFAMGTGEAALSSDADAPWSSAPFSSPAYGSLAGSLSLTAERLKLAEKLPDVSGAQITATMQPQRMDVDLHAGSFAGGAAAGGYSLHNIGGNVSAAAHFNLTNVALDALIWRRDERPVATGTVSLSAGIETTGSNAAGMIAGITGGGTLSLENGEVRYVNPNMGRSIVRSWDLGQEFTEDALRIVIEEQIDADSLVFNEIGSAFQIAAGTVRMNGLSVRHAGMEASGRAIVDMNTLSLDSDWTLTFDDGDSRVEGMSPKIGLLFRGDISSPQRFIDTLPFAAYLNGRREARMLEILAAEEASALERERLARLMVKLQQDREREERKAREAAEAEQRRAETAAALRKRMGDIQIFRRAAEDARELASLLRSAELAGADLQAAVAQLDAVNDTELAARAELEQLRATLDARISLEEEAAKRLRTAELRLPDAEAALSAARADSDRALASDNDAQQRLYVLHDEVRLANGAMSEAREKLAVAQGRFAQASRELELARQREEVAREREVIAQNELAEASARLSSAQENVEHADGALLSAQHAAREAQRAVDEQNVNARHAAEALQDAEERAGSFRLAAQQKKIDRLRAVEELHRRGDEVKAAERRLALENESYENAIINGVSLTAHEEARDRADAAHRSAIEREAKAKSALEQAERDFESASQQEARADQEVEQARRVLEQADTALADVRRAASEADEANDLAMQELEVARKSVAEAGRAFTDAEVAVRAADSDLERAQIELTKVQTLSDNASRELKEAQLIEAEAAAAAGNVFSRHNDAIAAAQATRDALHAIQETLQLAEAALKALRDDHESLSVSAETARELRLETETQFREAEFKAGQAVEEVSRAQQWVVALGQEADSAKARLAEASSGKVLTTVPIPRFRQRESQLSVPGFSSGDLDIDQPLLLSPLN